MNIFSIIEALETVDPELNDRLNPRRAAIKNITSFGSKVAVAALPFAFGTLLNRAYGQTAGDAVSVLNYALKLELAEAEFYNIGVATSGLIPTGTAMTALSTIRDHENAHVAFLTNVINNVLKGTAVTRASQGFGASLPAAGGNGTGPRYDFSGGSGTGTGPFATVFTQYATFLAVANAFEDTGVRAYKGQATNVINNQVVLTAALQIHSAEARHAAHIRQMRRTLAGSTLKPWITGTSTTSNDTGAGAAVDPNYGAGTPATDYPAENNVVQGGLTITSLPAVSGTTSFSAATEAFDEPLDAATVVNLVKIFGVK